MWPNENSLLILLFGLTPLAYVACAVLRRGLGELMSLGCLGALCMWVGYQLSPWLFYFSGEWMSSVLVEAFIDEGLIFSAFCTLAYVVGYEFWMRKYAGVRSAGADIQAMLPPIHVKWLFGLALLTLAMFVIRTEGFAEAWQSSVARGVKGWREIDTLGERACQLASVLYPVAALSLALTTAIYLLHSRSHNAIQRYALGISCLTAASLEGIWSFSRDAGSPFLIVAFMALKIRGRRAAPLAVACLFIVIWLGGIGRNYRQAYNPGLKSFLDAAVYGCPEEIDGGGDPLITPNLNPLSAIDAWTLKASLVESDRSAGWSDALLLAWNLHPFPSLIVPTAQIGEDLTEVMGTVGFSAVTTPALADLYYAVGKIGFLLLFPVGMIYAWFECLPRRRPSLAAFVCLVLCFASFPLGLHNGVRAMSRLPVYALIIYLAHRKMFAGKEVEECTPQLQTSTKYVSHFALNRPERAKVLPAQGTALGTVERDAHFRSNGPTVHSRFRRTIGPLGRNHADQPHYPGRCPGLEEHGAFGP